MLARTSEHVGRPQVRNTPESRAVADALRELRSLHGWSQEVFAARAGLTRTEINKIENYKLAFTGDRVRKALARAWEVDQALMDALLDRHINGPEFLQRRHEAGQTAPSDKTPQALIINKKNDPPAVPSVASTEERAIARNNVARTLTRKGKAKRVRRPRKGHSPR